MSWEKSTVMQEFLKIATESGMIKTAMPEPNPITEDIKNIEEKRLKTPDVHIMEVAHPEPAFVAESRGEGGLVENELEHQKKIVEMINKAPTGSLVGRYATKSIELLKIADLLDDSKQYKAADKLTKAAKKLMSDVDTELFFE